MRKVFCALAVLFVMVLYNMMMATTNNSATTSQTTISTTTNFSANMMTAITPAATTIALDISATAVSPSPAAMHAIMTSHGVTEVASLVIVPNHASAAAVVSSPYITTTRAALTANDIARRNHFARPMRT